jgi:phospholipid/cholesterol/gamma-HCH transport system permease protein
LTSTWTRGLADIIEDIGGCVLFVGNVVRTAIVSPCSRRTLFDQIYKVTIQSLPTTAMAGFFTGAIMTVQFTLMAQEFGALGYLGGLATSATFREVGPLLIAFMLAGKVGAFTAAELGTMRVTEQIDAIRCLGANPIQEIILPRFIGIIVSSFLLLAVGLVLSTVGGGLLGVIFSGISAEEYIRHIPTIVNLSSVASGLFKCFVFALMLAAVCTYKGYSASGGAKGVGKAVVNTAVATMIGIVLTDWLTSFLGEIVMNMVME